MSSASLDTFPALTLNDGTRVPGIAYGSGTAWYECEKDGEVSRPLVEATKAGLLAGFRHIDAAECYMNETSTGIAIVESGIPRDQLFICTKIATGLKDGKVAENFKSQLAKLQVSYVDLLLIHWPFELGANGFPAHEEAWKSLEALKDAGLARSIGVSNYRIADLQRTLAVAKHKISVNQIEMHPYVLKESKALLAFMAKHEIVCEAYAPTASLNKFPGGPVDAVVEKIAVALAARSKVSVEPSQVLLKYIQQRGMVVVTTSAKPWRMAQQVAAYAIGELTADEMAQIEQAGGLEYHREYMPHMEKEKN